MYDANDKGRGWSKETVLSYRYDTNTGKYSVIENRAWLYQLGADGQKLTMVWRSNRLSMVNPLEQRLVPTAPMRKHRKSTRQ